MKKLFIFLLPLLLLTTCEEPEQPVSSIITEKLTCGPVDFKCEGDTFPCKIDTAKFYLPSTLRANDGYFDIVVIADNFKGNNGLTLFYSDTLQVYNAIMNTAPFGGYSQLRIWFKNSKKSLNCQEGAGTFADGFATLCDPDKVISAVGNTPVDIVVVLANGKGFGSSLGQIMVVGLGNHAPGPGCTFYQAAFWGKMLHEIGHYFLGPNHITNVGNKMNSCCNGCCCIYSWPFLQWQQDTITVRMNVAI